MMILLLFMLLAIFLQFDIVKAFILDKIPIKIVVLFCGFSVVLFFFFYGFISIQNGNLLKQLSIKFPV